VSHGTTEIQTATRVAPSPFRPLKAVAALLHEFGLRTALRGGNPYRAKAYTRAAENLLALTEQLENLVVQGRLHEIPGVGDVIADIIKKLFATGTHAALEKMRAETPAGVLDMLTVPGLRPDKVVKLNRELGIASLEDLEEAAREGRVQKVKGLGAPQCTVFNAEQCIFPFLGWHMRKPCRENGESDRHPVIAFLTRKKVDHLQGQVSSRVAHAVAPSL
jgi:hypothetical protein